jgi:hypothetical protein
MFYFFASYFFAGLFASSGIQLAISSYD